MELLFSTLQDLLQVKAEIIRSKITDLGNLVTCVKKYNRSLENIRLRSKKEFIAVLIYFYYAAFTMFTICLT